MTQGVSKAELQAVTATCFRRRQMHPPSRTQKESPVKEPPCQADGKQSPTHYRWAVSSRGYMLTGRAYTEIDPSDYLFLHVFMDAAEAQARRDGIPFDAFNSDIRVVRD